MTVTTVWTTGFEEVRYLVESVAGRLWTTVLITSGVAALGYTASLLAWPRTPGARRIPRS